MVVEIKTNIIKYRSSDLLNLPHNTNTNRRSTSSLDDHYLNSTQITITHQNQTSDDEIKEINDSTLNTTYLNSLNASPSPSSSSSNSSKPSQSDEPQRSSISSTSDDLDDLVKGNSIIREEDYLDDAGVSVITDDEDYEHHKNTSKSNIIEDIDQMPSILLSHAEHNDHSHSLSYEVASLSSMTSNYSQFDFVNNRRLSPSPPPVQTTKTTSLTSFFFSSFNKSNQKDKHSTTLDLITSKLLNLTKNDSNKQATSIKQTTQSDTQSIKSNHSSHNICDLKMPSSVLIFENRPSNLPAKSQQEALKHKLEYEKMVEQAKKKELKEKELKHRKYEQQLKKEDFLANSLQIWNNEIIKNWSELKNAKRTHQLWYHGLPPAVRGKVWRLAIGNDLDLTKEIYLFYENKAKEKLEQIKLDPESATSSSVELIKLDVSRTFPQLCFFQSDGPLHNALHSVLGAYACYNTQIGYVQGMSFLTAILLLNMDPFDAFVCLANLLNTKYLLACFCMNQTKMNRYFRVHEILFEHNIPKLYRHFEEQKVKPDLYLIEWIFTLFSKSLNIEATSRIWDMFFRDQEEFLFKAALGILNMYKETLIQMDFIHIVQFLTKLPENINSTHLFKSIEQINTCIDDVYLTFKHLIDEVINDSIAAN